MQRNGEWNICQYSKNNTVRNVYMQCLGFFSFYSDFLLLLYPSIKYIVACSLKHVQKRENKRSEMLSFGDGAVKCTQKAELKWNKRQKRWIKIWARCWHLLIVTITVDVEKLLLV